MRTKWYNKNIEPSKLCSVVKEFFEKKGLCVKEGFRKDKCQIVVSIGNSDSSLTLAIVEMYGNSRELTVDYFPSGERRSTSYMRMFGSLLTLFGGGALVLYDLKKEEATKRRENDFWGFLDEYFAKIG